MSEENNPDIIKMKLHGGPHDGEEIEIHRDHLKYEPWLGEYKYVDGKFIYAEDPNDPRFKSRWVVCDDNGEVLKKVDSEEEVFEALDDLNDPSERWKFGRRK